jgi:hypothetical protein
MNDDERAGPPGPPPAPGTPNPAPPAGWVAPAPPPPRGAWASPTPGDPQPFAAAYVPQPGYAYGPPPPGGAQLTYQPGQGAFSVLPPAATGWNWGAFLFTWIWGVFNGATVTLWGLLLMFVPGGNIAWAIVCGINGNRWAWRGRPWTGVEQFRATQHKWAIAALIVFVAAVIVPIVIFIVVLAASHASSTGTVGG